MANSAFFLLTVLLIVCSFGCYTKASDEFGDSRLTKMEIVGILNEWCEADPWMVSFMKRNIACREEFLKANPDRKAKSEECIMKAAEGLKLDPSVLSFKVELLNTEEGQRNMTCTLMKKDLTSFMGMYHSIILCMKPSKEDNSSKFEQFQETCMSTKARAEEAAYDKEQVDKAKAAG